jgi:hypothetical protein
MASNAPRSESHEPKLPIGSPRIRSDVAFTEPRRAGTIRGNNSRGSSVCFDLS